MVNSAGLETVSSLNSQAQLPVFWPPKDLPDHLAPYSAPETAIFDAGDFYTAENAGGEA